MQTFIKLGLTLVQARIYATLIKIGYAAIGTIAKASHLDRSEVYRGISGLQRIGLVEQTVGKPSIFEGVPRNEGLRILLKHKTLEYCELQKKANKLIEKGPQGNPKIVQEDTRIVVLAEKDAALRRWIRTTESARESVDFIIRWKGFINGLSERKEHWERILDKGIRVRGIVSEPEKQKMLSGIITSFSKKGSYRIRYTLTPPAAVFSVIDKKEILITTIPSSIPSQTSCLWSNNPSLAKVIQDYFELQWRLSKGTQTKGFLIGKSSELIPL